MMKQSELVSKLEISQVTLESWTAEGWVRPSESEDGWLYSEVDVRRCRLIRELRDELDIDDSAIPVVLKLLDQLYGLRRELRNLVGAVDAQPEQVRAAVRKELIRRRREPPGQL